MIVSVPARQGRRRRGAGSARQGQRRAAAAAEDDRAAARRQVRSGRGAGPEHRAQREQAGPRHHRVRRQGPAAPARERQRRRPGARPRRPAAPDQRLARRRSAARLQPHGHRRRRARCRRRTSRSPAAASTRAPQSVTLRTRGRVQTVAEFNDIVVREKDGHPVRVADVARVEDGEAEPETIANVNGAGTVLLQVRRQSGTNTVEVVDGGQASGSRRSRATLPAGYDVRVVRDISEFIEASIHSVEEHLVVGSILAALVVLLFLGNLRSTIIAAIAIPTSIIATFGLIWYMGFTLN